MKYYSADRIHDGYQWITMPSVLVFEEDGTFVKAVPAEEIDHTLVVHYSGTLAPAFVNAHCHLELSHTKGLIPEDTGLVAFLGKVVLHRSDNDIEKKEAILKAMSDLQDSGCIAVGDIANTLDLVALRPEAQMHIHTFVETMGFIPPTAAQRFAYSEQIYRQYQEQTVAKHGYTLRQSIVPHAPYSVSETLFGLINSFESASLISIHNEETAAENAYFEDKAAGMHQLYEALRIDDTYFQPSGKTSLQTYLPYFDTAHPFILVHNTFMSQEDLGFIHAGGYKASLCLCPNANWYIERTLPDIEMLAHSGLNICLGTDSLASNHTLNIYDEVLKIQEHYPHISEEKLLCWATSGGAKALQLAHVVGSFTPGLKPGLVQIKDKVSKRIY
ncbi:amidohydrolase [Taibaiella sp. KBW10]|uniref:amidohydrolase family protein n=1 Tax=Taibaiella sp. KBW10 TaxID=2153357 RepID=UPI000F5AC077|nr:amidohydrolase family protein [Taibaiella sp. KBW10]RQO30498.1 amidohydrolase [Taibaiella sp. KBW10]